MPRAGRKENKGHNPGTHRQEVVIQTGNTQEAGGGRGDKWALAGGLMSLRSGKSSPTIRSVIKLK